MPERPIRIGIVGHGSIGKVHAEALGRCPGAELAGVAGRDDYQDLLVRPDVDLVCLCTPSGLHGRQALEALRAGKHVVVEKPLALTLAEGQAVVSESRPRPRCGLPVGPWGWWLPPRRPTPGFPPS